MREGDTLLWDGTTTRIRTKTDTGPTGCATRDVGVWNCLTTQFEPTLLSPAWHPMSVLSCYLTKLRAPDDVDFANFASLGQSLDHGSHLWPNNSAEGTNGADYGCGPDSHQIVEIL